LSGGVATVRGGRADGAVGFRIAGDQSGRGREVPHENSGRVQRRRSERFGERGLRDRQGDSGRPDVPCRLHGQPRDRVRETVLVFGRHAQTAGLRRRRLRHWLARHAFRRAFENGPRPGRSGDDRRQRRHSHRPGVQAARRRDRLGCQGRAHKLAVPGRWRGTVLRPLHER